ncbi:oxaloacetate decarboxylase [Reyranella sp.]|jgi:2-methylisocitrate lyase-like PEP mutase family enzyme|uniref:isocitrate lyase/PEP mutase family protein n=1 Tax=Reyranella sp. TaxID=1929291 RepID=UPI0027278013|nr:isocitrate lyase/PEP mutase family protein [Reyranella sp.]MDO8974732.1 isocitrate lyase/PEP mutase family protein [Reyranella sp.]
MTVTKSFRDAMKAGMVVAPGAYDCITARSIERAGFSAIYMTGGGTAASLGYPDFGLLTMTEMADNAGRIAASVKLPVIADADTGYGNELNAIRTVREYERRGVAGLHIEDQGFPKKCGHLEDKTIVPIEDYVAKIRAAVSAKADPNFMVIARTDARAPLGFEEAVRRANAAIEAGADMAFVEAPQTLDEVKAVPRLVKGPCMLNMVWRGKTPDMPLSDVEGLGYKLTILPGVLSRSVLGACEIALANLKQQGRHPMPTSDITPHQAFQLAGADEWDRYRTQFRQPSKQAAE